MKSLVSLPPTWLPTFCCRFFSRCGKVCVCVCVCVCVGVLSLEMLSVADVKGGGGSVVILVSLCLG